MQILGAAVMAQVIEFLSPLLENQIKSLVLQDWRGVLGLVEWRVLLYTLSCCMCVCACVPVFSASTKNWEGLESGEWLSSLSDGIVQRIKWEKVCKLPSRCKVRCSVSINSVALSYRCGNGRIWVVSWLIQGQWQVSTEQTKKTLSWGWLFFPLHQAASK